MTIKEASVLWGISDRRINELCKGYRIPGAYKKGKQWFIPDINGKKEISQKAREMFGSNAGIVQQSLFHCARLKLIPLNETSM